MWSIAAEFTLGTFSSVIYDAEATITGDLGNDPDTDGNALGNIGFTNGMGFNQVTLWYGGFDVGTDTNVGSPSASFDWSGTTQITTVPEPGGLTALLLIAGVVLVRRRNR